MKIILPALSLHTTRVLVLIYVLLGMVFAAYADECLTSITLSGRIASY